MDSSSDQFDIPSYNELSHAFNELYIIWHLFAWKIRHLKLKVPFLLNKIKIDTLKDKDEKYEMMKKI